jgi:hypothetical protein
MHRIIYSLHFEVEPLPERPQEITCLVVPLDRDGMGVGRGTNGTPRPPKRRAMDLRVGDYILIGGQWRKIKNLEAYRANVVSDEYAATTKDYSGYMYPLRNEPSRPLD